LVAAMLAQDVFKAVLVDVEMIVVTSVGQVAAVIVMENVNINATTTVQVLVLKLAAAAELDVQAAVEVVALEVVVDHVPLSVRVAVRHLVTLPAPRLVRELAAPSATAPAWAAHLNIFGGIRHANQGNFHQRRNGQLY